MRFGIFSFLTDETIGPSELAAAMEERGFESLFLPEHTHIPASRETPWPGGGQLPRYYYRTLDPFVALTAAAVVTERLLLGTGICLVVERDPITLAKEVATLDHLSGGRVLFGVGAGWNREEMRSHGTDPATRWALLRERILALKAIWANDEAEFHGRFVDFGPIGQWPKPVQRPHPPILLGANGPRALERVLEYADGWLPLPRGGDPATVANRIGELRRFAEQHGREPVPVSLYGARADPHAVEHARELGVFRYVFTLRQTGPEEALVALDRLAELAGT